MNEITISVYSYKGKKLFETIDNLIQNASNDTHLVINIKDQHPMNREKIFKELLVSRQASGSYHHVFWDWITSPILHKNELLRISKTKYHMFISDNIILDKDWDKKLIENLKDDSVISGKNKTVLSYSNLFYLNKNSELRQDFTLNNYIDRDLIFTTTKIMKTIALPTYLKYDGEEEVLSLLFYKKNIKVYSSPDSLYYYSCPTSIKNLYSTFSVSHNYNAAIDLMKDNYEFFKKYHNLDISSIKYLPFNTNDVEYNPNESKYDKIDGRRFIDKQNIIN